LSFGLQPGYAQEVTVARYSVLSTLPTLAQNDPLSTVVDVTLPNSITSVGDAVNLLLTGSGYALSEPTTAPATRSVFLALPLPDVHRNLGPMPLRTALEVLARPAFVVVEDPVHRLVSFEPCQRAGSEE
jgi:type IV pili sensor histidine kinase/response regulator